MANMFSYVTPPEPTLPHRLARVHTPSSLTYPDRLLLSSVALARGEDVAVPGRRWHKDVYSREVGRGIEAFRSLVVAHRLFDVHRAAGLRACREGTLLRLRLGPLLNPCSILVDRLYSSDGAPWASTSDVQEEPAAMNECAELPIFAGSRSEYVFVYGTLPRHVETGEEAFIIALGADDTVTVTISAVSAPGWWAARLCPPLTRLGQNLLTRRYLRAYERFGRAGSRPG